MKVLLTGGNGMLGTSIRAEWAAGAPVGDLIPVTRNDADLMDAQATRRMVERIAPDVVIHAAARVGGIAANIENPTGFLMDNLVIDTNLYRAAMESGVRNFLYFGSSCMYPKDYRQPLVESDVLAAPLEPTNEGYAISKIAAAKLAEYASVQFGLNYRVIIPSNLYGPHDDFSLGHGHLVAAAIAKVHAAKVNQARSVDVWGDGTARREFTYVGDLAAWVVRSVSSMGDWPVMMNVGFGTDHSVLDYYRAAVNVVGYDVQLKTDPTKPAGMHQKLMNSGVARTFGWNPSTQLLDGMRLAYAQYLKSLSDLPGETTEVLEQPR